MKKSIKILAVIISVVMLLSCFSATCFATEGAKQTSVPTDSLKDASIQNYDITVSSANGVVGGEVTVIVSVSQVEDGDFGSMNFTLSYDHSKLEFKSYNRGSTLAKRQDVLDVYNPVTNMFGLAIADGLDAAKSSELFKFTFKILVDVGENPGTKVNLIDLTASNTEFKRLEDNCTIIPGYVTITPTAAYNITYNSNGGDTTPSPQVKTHGTDIKLSAAITKKTIDEQPLQISYNADGGTAERESDTSTGKTSFEFKNWTATDGTDYSAGANYSKDESTTMTAQWQMYTSFTSVTLPGASRDDYTFTGWYADTTYIGKAGDSFTPTADMNLTAHWQPISPSTATLTWDLDGGEIISQPGTYTAAGSVAVGTTLIAPEVAKKGHRFVEWTPTVDDTMPAADTTYKAIWEKINYGDVDFNKTVNATDALLTLQAAVGKIFFTDRQAVVGDVDGNQQINSIDALLVLQYAVGKITIFPVEK